MQVEQVSGSFAPPPMTYAPPGPSVMAPPSQMQQPPPVQQPPTQPPPPGQQPPVQPPPVQQPPVQPPPVQQPPTQPPPVQQPPTQPPSVQQPPTQQSPTQQPLTFAHQQPSPSQVGSQPSPPSQPSYQSSPQVSSQPLPPSQPSYQSGPSSSQSLPPSQPSYQSSPQVSSQPLPPSQPSYQSGQVISSSGDPVRTKPAKTLEPVQPQKINPDTYISGAIFAKSPEEKTFKAQNGQEGKYTNTVLSYGFPDVNNPGSSIQGPVDIEYGYNERDDSGKVIYSAAVSFNIKFEKKTYVNTDKTSGQTTTVVVTEGRALLKFDKDPKGKIINMLDILHLDIGRTVTPHVAAYGISPANWMNNLGTNDSLSSLFPRLAYVSVDKKTLVPIPGGIRTQFVKLYGNAERSSGKCVFVDMARTYSADGKFLGEHYFDWMQLDGCRVIGVPLVRYPKLYGAKSKVSAQPVMMSCLVFRVERDEAVAKILSDAEAYASGYAGLLQEQRNEGPPPPTQPQVGPTDISAQSLPPPPADVDIMAQMARQGSTYSSQVPAYPSQGSTYPSQVPAYPSQGSTYPSQPPAYPSQPPAYSGPSIAQSTNPHAWAPPTGEIPGAHSFQ